MFARTWTSGEILLGRVHMPRHLADTYPWCCGFDRGGVVEWQCKPLATTLHGGGSGVMAFLLLNWSNSTVRVLPKCQSSSIQG